MAVYEVLINSVEKALDFNKIIDRCECDVDLVNGHTYVDAKSLVGIFSLPLYKPLEVIIHADEPLSSQIEQQLSSYIVKKVVLE